MNFEQLLYAEVLAHHKSMQKAADTLHISKSGLSVAIRQLETELGVQLFDKSANGTRLTSEGYQLISSISDILHDKNQLESTASLVASSQKNQQVSIQYMNSMPKSIMKAFIEGYSDNYRNLRIDVSRNKFTSIMHQVTEQKIDAGFVAMNDTLDNVIADLDFTPVGTSKLVLMCSPENPLANLDRSITLADLKTQRFSIFSDEFDRKLFERLQFQCGPLSLVARIDDTWAMEQVVTKLNTVCFGMISQENSFSHQKLDNLKWLDISNIIDDNFLLGWLINPDHVLPEQARRLIDEISNQLKKSA